jgi:hypothetical protein
MSAESRAEMSIDGHMMFAVLGDNVLRCNRSASDTGT